LQTPDSIWLLFALPDVYRFVWIRAFHPTITIRIERDGATIRIIVKRDADSYRGRPAVDSTSTAKLEDWDKMEHALGTAQFWNPVARSGRDGPCWGKVDGAEWLIEGRRSGRYRAEKHYAPHEPQDLAFREAALLLVQLGGLPLQADETY
jgi:hypothetical protein